MALLDLRIELFNDIIQHLTSDLFTSITGTLTPRELVSRLEDLKGAEPVQTKKDRLLPVKKKKIR